MVTKCHIFVIPRQIYGILLCFICIFIGVLYFLCHRIERIQNSNKARKYKKILIKEKKRVKILLLIIG